MTHFNGELKLTPTHLVTDLDGTYLPLPDHPGHHVALQALSDQRAKHSFGLVFCTGRHFESVQEVMTELSLPNPDWMICDVGTSIYHLVEGQFLLYPAYQEYLQGLVGEDMRRSIESLMKDVKHLSLQCESHQGDFKISYECKTEHTEALVQNVRSRLADAGASFDVHGSIDPFLNCGLIDLLPNGVSKASAVTWLASHADFNPEAVIYAGDSGNDLTALTAGFRAILVANHSQGLDRQVEDALGTAAEQLLFKATLEATSGVLEGCRHFGLIE